MQYHHDKKWGDTKKFQEINEAFGVIGDDKKKQQYDSYKSWGGGFGWMPGGFWGFWGFGNQGWFEVDLGDVMDQFFGGWRSRSWKVGPRKGEDIQVSLTITFEESYLGTTKTIEYSRKQKLEGMEEELCPTCKGHGRISQQSQTIFWVMQTQTVCPTCQGVGKLYKKDGKTISGWLEVTKQELEVTVPEGIDDEVYMK